MGHTPVLDTRANRDRNTPFRIRGLSSRDGIRTRYREVKKSKRIGSALVIVGGSLAASPTLALELGELTLQSRLGQPLRASIAYALAPNEAVLNTCVSLRAVGPSGSMPVNNVSIAVANGVITFTGGPVVREPVVSFRVGVRCPYTPRLTREYTLLVDPPGMVADTAPLPRLAGSNVTTRPLPARRPGPPSPAARGEPITTSSRYLVQPGDSLSKIAQRVEGAPGGWRKISAAIFEANADAFIGNDPNQLKAGSWLTIPGASAVASAPSASQLQRDDAAPSGPAAGMTIVGSTYEPEQISTPVTPGRPVFEFLDEIPQPVPLRTAERAPPG